MTASIILIYDSNCAEGCVYLTANTQDNRLMYCCIYVRERRGRVTSRHIVQRALTWVKLNCNFTTLSVYAFINESSLTFVEY